MINYLKDIKKETLIGQLPDVINNNNESIRNEFNWIFDSSLNRLTKSVYTPTGSVKAHFGEFTNLACEYFTVKNTDSIKASIQDSVESIINETLNVSSMQTVMAALTNIANSSFIDPSAYDISALCDISTLIVNHNVLNNRFKDSDFIDDDKQDFCHDAAAIVYQKENDKYITVKDALDSIDTADISINNLENTVNDINSNIEIINSSVNTVDENIQNLNNKTNNLFADIENISSNIQTINSSINDIIEKNTLQDSSINKNLQNINNIKNSINNISIHISNINKNNIIPEVGEDIYYFEQMQNNIIDAEIVNDGDILNIAFTGEVEPCEYEYKFSFIIKPGVSTMQFCIPDIDLESDDIYINNVDNEYKIQYNAGYFTITKNTDDDILYNIKFNRYQKYDGKMITILTYEKCYLNIAG